MFLQTQLLEVLLDKEYEGDEELLLGELQFCFIAFLVSFVGIDRNVFVTGIFWQFRGKRIIYLMYKCAWSYGSRSASCWMLQPNNAPAHGMQSGGVQAEEALML